MKILSYILCFIAGAATIYLIGKSKEASAIKKDHSKMIVTVTVEATTRIDSLLNENLVQDQLIADLKQSGKTKEKLLIKLIEKENILENHLLFLNEKLHTYDYFDISNDADSSALWLLRELRENRHRTATEIR